MGKVCHALPRPHLGQASLMVFMQQNRDKPGLNKNNRANERELPRIPFPSGFFPKINFVVWGKTVS